MFTYMLAPLMALALSTTSPPPHSSSVLHVARVDDSARAAVRVQVDNHNFLDMRIYAESNGRRWRLGTVTAFTSETFELPRFVTLPNDEVVLVASPIGSRGVYVAQPVLVEPGDTVQFNVENQLVLSNVLVRS